jgi:hypothetical protein
VSGQVHYVAIQQVADLGAKGHPLHVIVENAQGFPWATTVAITATLVGVVLGDVLNAWRTKTASKKAKARDEKLDLRERLAAMRSLRVNLDESLLQCERVDIGRAVGDILVNRQVIESAAQNTSLPRTDIENVLKSARELNEEWVRFSSRSPQVLSKIRDYEQAVSSLQTVIDTNITQVETKLRDFRE